MIASLLADPAWLAGFALMLLGLACQILVLTFEPVSVVQPVLASGVALVLVLSRLVLRERLGPWSSGAWPRWPSGDPAGRLGRRDGQRGWAPRQPGLDGGGRHPFGRHRPAGRGQPAARRSAGQRAAGDAAVCFGIGTGLLYGVAALAIKALSGILSTITAPRAS